MRKIFVIASREYRAAVRSKAFIVTLALMPILMSGSAGIQYLFKRLDDTKEKTYLLVDRSPGSKIAASLAADVDAYNTYMRFDPETNKAIRPALRLEIVGPSDNDADAVARQRHELSQRVEKEGIEAVVEIGPNVLDRRAEPNPQKATDEQAIRWQAKAFGENYLSRWLPQRINDAIQRERFARHKVDQTLVLDLQQPVPVKTKGLTRLDRETGEIAEAKDEKRLVNFFLPAVLIGLMFMIIMVGATPAMQGIVEEKGQRIAEVLLGSVTPFQLMAGKLFGVVAVSMTMAIVYLIGGYVLAVRYDVADMLPPSLIAWFVVMLFLALLMFGSLFIAIGAAAGDIKDTQTLLMPVMIIACLPFFALSAIMREPHGEIAMICSFVPFSTPMILVARESAPPGVPLWQMATGIALVLATTTACVWAAGRIFRIGILMQGKGAKLGDLVRWVIRG